MNTPFFSKAQTIVTAAVLLISGLTATAHAQVGQQVRAQIPFAFQQGSSHFAAGQYTLSLAGQNVLLVRGNKSAGYFIVNMGESLHATDSGKLVFQRYGNRYFLHQIWLPGQMTHIECPKSREEKDLQKEIRLASVEKKAGGLEYAMVETSR